MITVLIADQHRLFAQAVAAAIGGPDITILPDYPSTGLEAVKAVLDGQPDVALLDYWLPGMTGPAAARVVGKRSPRTRVILLSWFHNAREIHQAAASGAVAFIPKSFEVPQLDSAVREAAGKAGKPAPLTKSRGRGDAEDEDWDRLLSLTLREMEILALLTTESAESIARELDLTLGTVRNYIQKVLTKTATRTQLEAVDLARQHGVV